MSTLLFKGFYASTLGTFKWLYISALGLLAKKYHFVDNKFKNFLSKVVANLVLPCFVFAQIVDNFRISQYIIILHSTIGNIIVYFFGLFTGYIVAKVLKLKKSEANLLSAVFSTPHNTSIYVILIQSLGPFLDTILPNKQNLVGTAAKRGLLYVIINSIYSNIWKWSFDYYIIGKDMEDLNEETESHSISAEGEKINDTSSVDCSLNINQEQGKLKEKEDNKINEKEEKTDVHKKKVKEDQEQKVVIVVNNNNSNNNTIEKPNKKPPKSILKSIINTPLIASIISLSITFFPKLQQIIISPGFLRDTLIDVNKTVAKSYSFMVIFILGLSFSDSINYSKMSKNKIKKNFTTKGNLLVMAAIKLIIMPILTAPIIIFVFRNILNADDVLTFNFLFLAAAPSAINIIVICSYKNIFLEEISSIMIVMYLSCIITLTINISLFFYILGTLNASNASSVPPVGL